MTKVDLSFLTINRCTHYKVSFSACFVAPSAINGNKPLFLQAGSGDISVNGAIGNTALLSSLAIAGKNISVKDIGDNNTIGVSGDTLITATTAIAFTGTTYKANKQTYEAPNFVMSEAAKTFTSSGDNIAFQTGSIKLENNSNLTVNSNGGNINLGEIRGTSDEDLTLNAGTGTVSVGAIGFLNGNEINAISITADEINLTGNVFGNTAQIATTTKAISLGGVVTGALNLTAAIGKLQDDFSSITIGKATGGNITVNAIAFADPVTILSGGNINLNGLVTGTDNASITLNGAAINLNAGITTIDRDINITATGNDGVKLGNNIILDTGLTGGGNIRIAGNINGTTADVQGLVLRAGSGDITIKNAVGNITPLGDLVANSTGTTKFNTTVKAASLLTDIVATPM